MKRRLAWLRATCTILLLLSGGTARAEDADEANPYLVKSLPRATDALAQALSLVKPLAATLSANNEVGSRETVSIDVCYGTWCGRREPSLIGRSIRRSPCGKMVPMHGDVAECLRRIGGYDTTAALGGDKAHAAKNGSVAQTDQPRRVLCRSRSVAASRTQASRIPPAAIDR